MQRPDVTPTRASRPLATGAPGRTGALTARARGTLRALSTGCSRRLSAHPRLKGSLIALARRLGVYERLLTGLRRVAAALATTSLHDPSPEQLARALRRLPPAARQAFHDLNAEIDRRRPR